MEINRIYANTTAVNREIQGDRSVHRTAPSTSTSTRVPATKERRRRPDRRQRQLAFQGPDRRMRKERRQPKLLHARTTRPEQLHDRRGSIVDASV